jgi:hypothetical protein
VLLLKQLGRRAPVKKIVVDWVSTLFSAKNKIKSVYPCRNILFFSKTTSALGAGNIALSAAAEAAGPKSPR